MMRQTNFSLLFLAVFSLLLLSCSESKDVPNKNEKVAENLAKRANILLKAGKKVKAMELYSELATKYPETKIKKIVEEKLLKKGISIEKGLNSLTAKSMIQMENRILDYKALKGEYPTGHAIKHPVDGWGNEIHYRLFPKKKGYDFIVYSNGPDKIKGTNDDLLVVHTRDDEASGNSGGRSAGQADSGSMSLSDVGALGGEGGSGASEESSVSLDQLKGLAQNSGSISGEKELSLDQLKSFAEQ